MKRFGRPWQKRLAGSRSGPDWLVLVDQSILVAALLSRDTSANCHLIVEAGAAGAYRSVSAAELQAHLFEVMLYPRHGAMTEAEVRERLNAFWRRTKFVRPADDGEVYHKAIPRDTEDALLLRVIDGAASDPDLASCRKRIIVSDNTRDLKPTKGFYDVMFFTSGMFVAALNGQELAE